MPTTTRSLQIGYKVIAPRFPTVLDRFPNPGQNTLFNDASEDLQHDIQHRNVNDTLAQIEQKLGINNSPDSQSIDYRLMAVEAALGGPYNAWGDEFTGTSLDAKWLWVNQSTSTATVVNGGLIVGFPASGSGDQVRCLVQACPGASWRIETKVSAFSLKDGYTLFGLVARESSTGKMATVTLDWRTNDLRWELMNRSIARIDPSGGDWTTLGSPFVYYNYDSYWAGPFCLAIELSGGNLIYSVSHNSILWQVMSTIALPGSFTTAPDQVGIVVGGNSARTDNKGVFEYIRKVS